MDMKVSPETIEKVKAHMLKNGARGTAKTLVDQFLRNKIGLTSDDLPDTATFASGLDDIESLLGEGEFVEAFEVARDTATAMLEEEGGEMGMFESIDALRSTIRSIVVESLKRG